MLIAVTEMDEVNIFACMLAKHLGVPTTVARIRNPEIVGGEREGGLTREEMGIDIIINPERAAAQEIAKMIRFPEATDIEYYAQGKVMLVSISISEQAGITNKSLNDLSLTEGCIIVGIKKSNGDFVIPGGQDIVNTADTVYLLGNTKVMREASWYLHPDRKRIHRLTIMGGGMIGRRLAGILEKDKQYRILTKIIEKNPELCEELNCILTKTIVLQGDGTEVSYLNEEEIIDADVLVAVTGDDRTNILISMLGQKLGIKKVISEVENKAYASVYEKLGLKNTVNPHMSTAAKILRLTHSESVVSLSFMKDVPAEAVEIIIPESSKINNTKVAEAGLPRGLLIGSIVRKGQVIIPHGQTLLKAKDQLVIFARPDVINTVDSIFS